MRLILIKAFIFFCTNGIFNARLIIRLAVKQEKSNFVYLYSMEFKIHENNNHIIAMNLDVSSQDFFEYLDSVLSEDRPKRLVSYLLDKKINQICLIKNIWVDENERGKGIGKKLMNQVLDAHKDVPVLLLADYLESQKDGFSLIDWYDKFGFETIPFFSISGPFLIKK